MQSTFGPRGLNFGGQDVDHGLTVIRPVFYTLYIQALPNLMPDQVAVAAMICFAGLFIWIGATIGPETKNVVLNNDASFTV